MTNERKQIVVAVITAVVCALVAFGICSVRNQNTVTNDHIKVGFVLDGDESAPYSSNFIRAIDTIKETYANKVDVEVRYNVPQEKGHDVLEELANAGCALIISNSYNYGKDAKQVAAEFPNIQFCEATCDNANNPPVLSNYHTFMGEIYQGRYVAGRIAGMKLNEMIDEGQLNGDEVWVGYVGAHPVAEVISGYTAFFLGVRSECPQARMKVKYTHTWGNYGLEMQAAKTLLDEGCAIISQHTNTIASAVACEEESMKRPVYHVGYNQDMADIAPTVSLVGTRINWTPYCLGAVNAVLQNKRIEDVVSGTTHGNDMSAGFKEDWVSMLTLNAATAPEGSREVMDKTVAAFRSGSYPVFIGNYVGVDPENKSEVWDLRTEYHENQYSSAPTFHYVLQDVIQVE